MASTFAFEFPACFQANALQNRYSARSPVGLFALRVTPRLRSSSPSLACSANNCGGVSSDRFISKHLLQTLALPPQAFGGKFSNCQPFRVKDDAFLFAIPHVVIERHVVGGVVGRIDHAEFIYRDDMHAFEVRNIHSEHPRDGPAILTEGMQPVEVTIDAFKAFIAKIRFPPCVEFA